MDRSRTAACLLLVLAAWSCGSKARVGDPSKSTQSNSVTMDQEFELSPGQSALVGTEPLKVTFDALTADSRCPTDVNCVWEGDATARISAATGTQALVTYELHTHTGFTTQVTHGAYRIRLVGVAPAPRSTVTIDPATYVITLLVTRP